MRLFLDVCIFALILFQKRVFQSEHFLKLKNNTTVVDALASKIRSKVYRWNSIKNIETRQLDVESLEKIKEKLRKIRELKEQRVKRQSTHTQGTHISI